MIVMMSSQDPLYTLSGEWWETYKEYWSCTVDTYLKILAQIKTDQHVEIRDSSKKEWEKKCLKYKDEPRK